MIRAESVCVKLGKREILHQVSFEAQQGHLCCIIGPNGSGKTTLLRTLSGLLRPESGELCIGGRNILSYTANELARTTAFLPQLRQTPPMTVRRLVRSGRYPWLSAPRRYTQHDEELTEDALRQVGMLEFADRELSMLSGGERQKAYLAMCLCQDTPILLLDEPTSFLDVGAKLALLEELKALSRKGKCVVMVLHDLELALQQADRIALLADGVCVGQGSPSSLVEEGLIDRVFGVKTRCFTEGAKTHYAFLRK